MTIRLWVANESYAMIKMKQSYTLFEGVGACMKSIRWMNRDGTPIWDIQWLILIGLDCLSFRF